MKNILLIGAGRSTASLIDYLLESLERFNWNLVIADRSIHNLDLVGSGNSRVSLEKFDVANNEKRRDLIQQSDIVISMLPAHMHIEVAKDCITFKKHMVTASYISKEMKALTEEAKSAGIVIMNEIGVDPGIDHISAMQILDGLKSKGAEIKGFESFTGGLVSPESDDNPWNYKFTWNPRNVVLAGQGGAVKFIQEGTYKYIPYHKLFRRTELIEIDKYGWFEGYANRDSLKYREVYGLENIETMYRGTLRRPGFCRAWDTFVQLGATDDSYVIENSENMTFREFINLFLSYNPTDSVELKMQHYLNMAHDDIELFEKLKWLGIFEDQKIGIPNATPAQILQHILQQKWTLSELDKDMIVMWHKFNYFLNGENKELHSSMVIKGKDQKQTAMAMTVGLPVAIAAKMILLGEIHTPGVHLPIQKEVYEPILKELEKYGITFLEKEIT